MSNKNVEFYVEYWVTGESGLFTVIGRCGDEPIRVGDTFEALIRYKHRKYPDEVGDEPIRLDEKPIALRVVCIHAYEKSLKTLGQGMTGSLVLEGEGTRSIAAGWALGQRESARAVVASESSSALS